MSLALGGFELEMSAVALGAITGLTYGILAVGLVLVYRSNRIINFAHGEIGAFAAALLSLAVTRWHVPYWVAFPLALGVGGCVGGLSEVVVVRRLRNAPGLMSVIATLGLAQFLLLFSLVINSQVAAGTLFPQPEFLPEFDIGALRVTRAYSGMLLLTPLVLLVLVRFLLRSRTGLAIRASAANRDAARMAGVSAGRMSTLAWVIAGVIAAFTAMLVLPARGFTSAEFLGPGLLLRALVAAVVARMVNLPTALLAGLALGVLEQIVLWNYPSGGMVEAVLFVAILVTLLVQPRRGGREEAKGSWAAVQPWPPLPEALRSVWAIRNLGRLAALAGVTLAALVPLYVTNATATILVVIMAFALVGLSLGIMTGLAGELSLGQFALAGVGAAVSYGVTALTHNIVIGVAAAGLGAAAMSLVIGLPALRIRGLMLAVTTLAFALAARNWFFEQSWVFGEGVGPERPSFGGFELDTGKEYYFFGLALLVVGFWFARNVWSGGLGRRLRALRDNEDAARAFAVGATSVKLQGFALAGFLAGLGGALYGHALSLLSASAFPVDAGIDVAAMAVLGGVGLLAGPLIGAFYIIGVPEFLPLDSAGLAATALGWLVLILYFPGGIAQLMRPLRERVVDGLARHHGLDPVALRLEATDPGVTADFEGTLTHQRERPRERAPEPGGALDDAGPLLSVAGISKSYGGIRAVDGVSLEVARGETLGLIGPNGAGKTTLFEVISGFTPCDAGSVRLDGQDVGSLGPAARARLGLIRSFQDAALFPTLTVLEVVQVAFERLEPTRFVSAVRGRNAAEERKDEMARDVLGTMGLYGYRNTPVRELSTGTRRIAELACVVALRPTVVLLDEPSSGIAQRETEALGELLVRLREHLDLTLLVIEHDMPLITGVSDRLLAMEAGRVIASGSPEVVRNHPEVVRSYLGTDARAIERSGDRAPGRAERRRTAPPDGRCTETTRAGYRCSRPAGEDGLCTQHRKLAAASR